MELTNLVVNRTAENIAKAFGDDIEKARHGIYADTPENRRLRRVGQEYGSKKAEEAPKGRPQAKQEEPKDERFSADGIVGKDGSFNKQGASYKRWAALREKVETGKATPEEKKEFAHIHNQYLNEKSRSEYERNKANDPNAKEPKYETVEERTARVRGKKEENKQKENDGKEELNDAQKAWKRLEKDEKVQDLAFSIDGLCFSVYNDPNGQYGKLVEANGYDPQSRKVKDYVFATTLEVSKPFYDEIYEAVKKYGKETMINLFNGTDLFREYEGLADYVISEAVTAKKKESEQTESGFSDEDVKKLTDKGYKRLSHNDLVANQPDNEKWVDAYAREDKGIDKTYLMIIAKIEGGKYASRTIVTDKNGNSNSYGLKFGKLVTLN